VQSEKMAALGQLVGGVAHEINNPVNFISSGLPSLRRDINKIAELVPEDHRDNRFDKVRGRLDKLAEAIGEGAQRTAQIVKNLRTFSRLDEAELKTADLHQALDVTLSLLHNQTKDRILIVRDYGDVPAVECYVSQINQVFMNLLVNAIQAIDDDGTITLTTSRDGDDRVRISISDTGVGMSEDVRQKIFDPFFTTKPVGQGTGLGLSITHGIMAKHRGTIDVESEPGRGTEFILTLPVRVADAANGGTTS
jgi:two-component system NtrC family sensor kinase